ncbi:hypothetical protein EJB05_31089, partial [Eragrostis curvula]
MDTSNNMFAALKRITSSIFSTANTGFGRVLKFTGSFNDRTSLLLADDAPGSVAEQEPTTLPPPSQSQQASTTPVTTAGAMPFDIEAATPENLAGGGGEQGRQEEPTAQDAEAKRVAKIVHTVSLFAASASLVLFVNLPGKPGTAAAPVEEHGGAAVLYSLDTAFICLALSTSLGLSMYSIVARSSGTDPAVARVQKRAMVMAVAFVLVSFTLHVCMMLPAAALESAWLVFVLLAGAVAVYLALAWRFGGAAARGAEVASSAGAADLV